QQIVNRLAGPQVNLRPDCRSMLLRVPIGKSFAGCFTVTIPFFVGCLKWWWEPLTRASLQPSASKSLMICRESIALPRFVGGNISNIDVAVNVNVAQYCRSGNPRP